MMAPGGRPFTRRQIEIIQEWLSIAGYWYPGEAIYAAHLGCDSYTYAGRHAPVSPAMRHQVGNVVDRLDSFGWHPPGPRAAATANLA
jgi:hypothetical protein